MSDAESWSVKTRLHQVLLIVTLLSPTIVQLELQTLLSAHIFNLLLIKFFYIFFSAPLKHLFQTLA